jgi:hypothetical protein
MMTIQEAAYKILEEAGKPLTSKEIAVIALNKHMVISNAKDPPFSLASTIDKNIRDGIYNKPRLKFDHTPQGRKIRLPSWELNPPASSGPPFGTIGYVELKAKIPSDLFEKIQLAGQAKVAIDFDELVAFLLKKGLLASADEIKKGILQQLNQFDNL